MNKLVMLSCLIGMVASANAIERDPQVAMAQIESAFVPQSAAYTINTSESVVTWPTWLDLKISNKFLFVFNSKYPITVSKITLNLDNTIIDKSTNLLVKPNVAMSYLFSDVNLPQIVQSIDSSYKFMGIFKQISVTDFAGLNNFKYKRLTISVSWTNGNKDYSQASTYYMMVMAK